MYQQQQQHPAAAIVVEAINSIVDLSVRQGARTPNGGEQLKNDLINGGNGTHIYAIVNQLPNGVTKQHIYNITGAYIDNHVAQMQQYVNNQNMNMGGGMGNWNINQNQQQNMGYGQGFTPAYSNQPAGNPGFVPYDQNQQVVAPAQQSGPFAAPDTASVVNEMNQQGAYEQPEQQPEQLPPVNEPEPVPDIIPDTLDNYMDDAGNTTRVVIMPSAPDTISVTHKDLLEVGPLTEAMVVDYAKANRPGDTPEAIVMVEHWKPTEASFGSTDANEIFNHIADELIVGNPLGYDTFKCRDVVRSIEKYLDDYSRAVFNTVSGYMVDYVNEFLATEALKGITFEGAIREIEDIGDIITICDPNSTVTSIHNVHRSAEGAASLQRVLRALLKMMKDTLAVQLKSEHNKLIYAKLCGHTHHISRELTLADYPALKVEDIELPQTDGSTVSAAGEGDAIMEQLKGEGCTLLIRKAATYVHLQDKPAVKLLDGYNRVGEYMAYIVANDNMLPTKLYNVGSSVDSAYLIGLNADGVLVASFSK